jgi:hypothetical protein
MQPLWVESLMPNDACNPHNVVAKLAGVFDAGGIETTEGAINVLDDNAKSLFHQIKARSSSQALQASASKAAKTADDIIDSIVESEEMPSIKERVRGGLMDLLKPADFLPEDVTGPVFSFLDDFFARNHQNLKAARNEYNTGIRQVLNEISDAVENLNEATKGQAAHWMRDLREGYPFYGKNGTIWDQARSNVVSNVLDFSGTIILGNPLEFIIKAPSLYGIRPSFQGLTMLAKETKGNLWAKVPELESAGVYGMKIPKGKGVLASLQHAYNTLNDKIMAVTDRPLKNLAYYTGKAKGGSGTEAVEKIAFKNRWGNDPRIGRKNRDAVTVMNYTLNTYYMLAGMGKGLATPGKRAESLRQLGMWAALTSMIGGPAAVIPAPLSAIFRAIDGYKEWEDANINTVGKMIRPGGVVFGLGSQFINRAGEAWNRGMRGSIEKFSNGDTTGGMLDLGEAGMAVSSILMRSPLGNLRVQKLLRNTRDLFEGDMDFEEFKQKSAESFLPDLKQQ